jgi:histone H3/H4
MAKKKAPELPNFLVKSVCKEALKAHDVNVAGDALDGLNNVVGWYIAQAASRAKANKRKTVQAHDFLAPCEG